MAALGTGRGLADVVVTAFASTTSLAPDSQETWRALLRGESGIHDLDYPFVEQFQLPVRIGGKLRENVEGAMNRVELRRMTHTTQIATLLARRAWEHAGAPEVDTRRLVVSVGHGYGATQDLVDLYDAWRARGMRAASPLAVQMHMPNAPAAAVGLERGAKAGVIAPMAGDASGAAAIGEAWRVLALGEADVAICGGVESAVEATPIAAFANRGLLSTRNTDPTRACRPFDRDRDGTVLSEAGALLVIETEQHATARGAPILARLMGYGLTSDGFDLIDSEPSGVTPADAVLRALRTAGLTAADISHVNAHAAGTRFGDLAEAKAITEVFGRHAPAVYAPKAALGQSMGAAGAVEAILTVQALSAGMIPPTLNFEHRDPEIDLDIVAGEPRSGQFRYAIKTSFALGGHNVALVFGKY